MAKNKVTAGIELGSSKITTLIAHIDADPIGEDTNINIVGAASSDSKGIRKGQIVDLEEAVEATIESVEAAERMAGYNLGNASVAIGGAHISSLNTHGVVAVSDPGNEVNSADIERVIEAASAVQLPSSREVIHILPREFIVDGEAGVKDPVGMSGVRLEVETHLVTGSQAAIKNLRKVMNEVGINIDELIFSGIAASEAVLTKTEKELGCVLVDIGGGVTSIAVYIEGGLTYSSVIPIGSKNVTNDIAIGLRVSLENAEKIKVLISSEKENSKKKIEVEDDNLDLQAVGITDSKKVSKKTLKEGIIRPRMNEIFTMVKLQLEKEKLANQIPSGIIVTGGGAAVAGTEDSAKRMLGLPARIGSPKGIGGLVDDILTPAFATPVGLILHATKNTEVSERGGFAGKLKLPVRGVAAKIIESIKDLLP